MTNAKKKVVIIATDPLLTAFQILILSAPTLDLLAAEVSLSAAREKTEKRPDIVLVVLEKDNPPKGSEYIWPNKIVDLKGVWPGVYIIAIISDPQQRKEIQTSGADDVLFEGITPHRLLASIEKVELVD